MNKSEKPNLTVSEAQVRLSSPVLPPLYFDSRTKGPSCLITIFESLNASNWRSGPHPELVGFLGCRVVVDNSVAALTGANFRFFAESGNYSGHRGIVLRL